MADSKKPEDGQAPEAQAAPKRFRVVHAAVSGIAPDKNGKMREHDYYAGRIVDERQLDGNAAQYFALGAIEPVEELE